MNPFLVELVRGFKHFFGAEFDAKSAALASILDYVYLRLRNFDFLSV